MSELKIGDRVRLSSTAVAWLAMHCPMTPGAIMASTATVTGLRICGRVEVTVTGAPSCSFPMREVSPA